jgi:regulator of replication initiation timing
MNKEKLTVFAVSTDYKGYTFDCDSDKLLKYYKVHGYGFVLTLAEELKELVNELKAIKFVIDILTEWQDNEWFEISKTTYEINWNNCYNNEVISKNKSVTLPQAQKLYTNTKEKYELLISIFQETFRVHNKDPYGNAYCIDEFLTEIEI